MTRAAVWLAALGAVSACGGEVDDTPPPAPVEVSPPPPAPAPPPPAPGLPGPSWTDLRFPEVPGWQRQEPQDHGPAQGYMIDYQHDGAGVRASIFVYTGGQPGIRRNPAILARELANATSGVHRAQQAGAYEAVRELDRGSVRLGAAPDAPIAERQRLVIVNQGVERESAIYLSTHRAFFFKIRTTVQRGPSPAVDAAIAQMLGTLGALLREDAAPAPTPEGSECDALARCCEAARAVESSAGLFCQLSAARGGSCTDRLASVRTYLAERGTAAPPACQ